MIYHQGYVFIHPTGQYVARYKADCGQDDQPKYFLTESLQMATLFHSKHDSLFTEGVLKRTEWSIISFKRANLKAEIASLVSLPAYSEHHMSLGTYSAK